VSTYQDRAAEFSNLKEIHDVNAPNPLGSFISDYDITTDTVQATG
jgi:hypothetical protein